MRKTCLLVLPALLLHAGSRAAAPAPAPESAPPPNLIVILADDLGYGDITPYGSTVHRTPSLARLAAEGIRLTDFYVSPVCTPTRAALLTASYPRRIGLHQGDRDQLTLYPGAHRGLHPDEVTLAEILKRRGYATAIVGKWHLGDQPELLPTRHGFDSWFGLPYSNDMGREGFQWRASRAGVEAAGGGYHPLPLLRGEEVIETEPDQGLLTRRYTEEAIRFLEAHRDRPFFLYLPHTMPHQPVHASPAFAGRSAGGVYGDTIEEIDWSVGEILAALDRLGLAGRTLVVFTSDNGANLYGGSNGPLRGWKTTTWEGGVRVPFLARWPGRIPGGAVSAELVTIMDVMPTFARLARVALPDDRALDGRDVWPILAGAAGARSPHERFLYYFRGRLEAVRAGRWKLSLGHADTWTPEEHRNALALYDLAADPGETTNLAGRHPEVVARLTALAEEARAELGDDATGASGTATRPAGFVAEPRTLTDFRPADRQDQEPREEREEREEREDG